jgi:protein-export membrane protein SecD
MQARTRWWLLAVVALAVVALVGVLEPIKFRDRRDPDTGRPVKPLDRIGPIRLYRPHIGLRLGLDLRGGMHLVLEAQEEGVFRYQLKDPVSEEKKPDLLAEIARLIPKETLGTVKREIAIEGRDVTIRTRILDPRDFSRQDRVITDTLTKQIAGLTKTGSEPVQITRDNLSSIRRILEDRVNASGMAEPVIQEQPPNRIVVELPGVKDPAAAEALIQRTAVLKFLAIPKQYAFGEDHPPVYDESRRQVVGFTLGDKEVPVSQVMDESEVIASGRDLKRNSSHVTTTQKGTAVTFAFTGAARSVIENYTRANLRHYMAVVMDNKMYSCPIIQATLTGGEGVIEGGFDRPGGLEEARDLSILLNAGALPFDLEYVENRTVSPELGEDALQKSLFAGLVGMGLVLVFMVAYYRLPGLLADVALIIYCALLMGAIKLMDQVLTLPGILAVIISVGMAVDANIIIFERLKEEIRSGKTMRSAVEAAFKRAWAAIFDSNMCSIGTGIVLYGFGTGPIKGFAVALVVGVAVSLFTAVTVTRLFMSMIVDSRFGHSTSLFGVSAREIERS